MSPKKHNNLLPSGRWSIKYPKDAQIIYLAVVAHRIADDSNKLSEASKRDPTKADPANIRDLPPYILEYPKWVVGNKNKG